MPRKKWSLNTEITSALLKSREKRKWQIALRRYVLEKNASGFYAPYFGLDIINIRHWFESQFENDINWADFAVKWQFGHVIPVTYFDSFMETDLKLCWNFLNLRVEPLKNKREVCHHHDLLYARKYFEDLYRETEYSPCGKLLDKIKEIEVKERINSAPQQKFILKQKKYLAGISKYSAFEFELLNNRRSIEEIEKEVGFMKKYEI